jgi:hypothetical protein
VHIIGSLPLSLREKSCLLSALIKLSPGEDELDDKRDSITLDRFT